jgi:hypothetical protein
MKMHLFCSLCELRGPLAGVAEVSDEGIADVQCENGHHVYAVLSNEKFEVLFDSGCLAIRDEYHREAVASFAAALENFFGYFVRITARKFNAPDETIDPLLKKRVKLSERRRGAMELAYLLLTGTVYESGDDKPSKDLRKWTPTKFRNEVVHEGVFPTKDEAMAYARWIYDTIIAARDELKKRVDEGVFHRDIGLQGAAARRDLIAKGINAASHNVNTVLGMGQHRKWSFDCALQEWSQFNAWDFARLDEQKKSQKKGRKKKTLLQRALEGPPWRNRSRQ